MKHSSMSDTKGRRSKPAGDFQRAQRTGGVCPEPAEGTATAPWLRALRRGLTLSVTMIVLSSTAAGAGNAQATLDEYAEFAAAVETSDDARASSLGESLFAALKREYAGDSGFRALESRLKAAEFLAGQMQQQLTKAAGVQLSSIVGEVPGGRGRPSDVAALTMAPAKHFYDTSVRVFSNPVHIGTLTDEQRAFLARYYDLRLRSMVAAVARAGQALAIAEPRFTSTHDYVLVLPLLHAGDRQPLNIDVLPRWLRGPEQLTMLSDSCLFRFESPFQAMVIARRAAEMQGKTFSESDFYRTAGRRCGSSRAKVAVECLREALAAIPGERTDSAIDLEFDIVQIWLSSGNYLLAAGEAREIFEKHPSHSSAGRAIWLHYYALSRNSSTEEILANIDKALTDDRCRPYEPRLLYIKWWALRRQRNQSARVAALEYDLLKRYGGDPMIAPILLSRATDLLASQSYHEAGEVLQQLVQKFPSTQAAVQAQRMLERLKTTKTN